MVGVALGLLVVVAAVGAPFISPLDPFAQSAAERLNGPDAVHFMGVTHSAATSSPVCCMPDAYRCLSGSGP